MCSHQRIFVAEKGDRELAENVAVLIVDGPPNRAVLDTLEEAEALRHSGVVLIAIGVGPYIEREYLTSLTGNTHRVMMVHNYTMLTSHVGDILTTIVDSFPAGTGQYPLPDSTGRKELSYRRVKSVT